MTAPDVKARDERTTALGAPRPPRPWLAALLSLLVPGLGQLYDWRPLSALLCWLAAQAAGVIAIPLLIEVSGPIVLVAVLLLILGIHLAIAAHAWVLARLPDAASRHRPDRPLLAAVMCAAFAFAYAIGSAEQRAMHHSGLRAFRIPSGAMSPGIIPGDMLFVQQRAAHDTLRRDEIVVYRFDGNDLIKRVAGVGGDTLAMRGGRLVRNGRALAEPWARTDSDTMKTSDADFGWQRAYLVGVDTSTYHASVDTWGPLVVPAGRVFVLGDNRHNSLDSRYAGFVDADSVFGRPTRLFFSYDGEARVVRWSRIGATLR
ncbi:MAG TPA: signal peptidase I [Gemmatimonadaceae bacterium]|nr:signal peptidase I [Gemmatimonadaceae bacterium]